MFRYSYTHQIKKLSSLYRNFNNFQSSSIFINQILNKRYYGSILNIYNNSNLHCNKYSINSSDFLNHSFLNNNQIKNNYSSQQYNQQNNQQKIGRKDLWYYLILLFITFIFPLTFCILKGFSPHFCNIEHFDNPNIDRLIQNIIYQITGNGFIYIISGPRGIGKTNSMRYIIKKGMDKNILFYYSLENKSSLINIMFPYGSYLHAFELIGWFLLKIGYEPYLIIDDANNKIQDAIWRRENDNKANLSHLCSTTSGQYGFGIILLTSGLTPLEISTYAGYIRPRHYIIYCFSTIADENIIDWAFGNKDKNIKPYFNFESLSDSTKMKIINTFGNNCLLYMILDRSDKSILKKRKLTDEIVTNVINDKKKEKKNMMQKYLLPKSYTVGQTDFNYKHIVEDEKGNIISTRTTYDLYRQWLYLYDMIKNIQKVAEEKVNNDQNYQKEIKKIDEDNKLNENEKNDEKLKIKNKYLHKYEHNGTYPMGALTMEVGSVNLLVKHHILTPTNEGEYVIYDLFTYRCLLEMINDIRLNPNNPTENFSDWNEYVVNYIKKQRKNYSPIKNLPRSS